MNRPKLFRVTTIPLSVEKLLGKQLTFMNQYFDLTAISSDKKKLEKVGKELGVKIHSIEMSRKITPLKDLISLLKMSLYFLKEKPDIVHTHTPKAGLIGMLASKIAGINVRMHTVAGLPLMEAKGFKRKLLNFIEKITYYCATDVYPNSFGLYDFILNEKFCKKEKLKVIGNGSSNGIDTEYFNESQISEEQKSALKKNFKISDDDFVFVFVGRLVKDKGINELVSVFQKICQEKINNHNVKLLLVGPFETDLDPLSESTLSEIKQNPDIITVGYQKDVRPFFAISNCLVFPSYREGFPNVVLQAGAMGLPAIVTDINGCNEIIENGKNGIIVQPKSEDDLLNAMYFVSGDFLSKNQIKEYARYSIVSKFDQQKLWKDLYAEYQSKLSK
jgi:glycosyltransferase involved in cell wall biosynthesis